MAKSLFTIDELTELTGLSRSTLYREIKSGRLFSLKIRGCRRVTQDALDRYLRNYETEHRESQAGLR